MLGAKSYIRGLSALGLAFCLWGCGSSNSSAPAVNASGAHPAGWIIGHRAAYHADPDQCRECHGDDLRGGITRIDCFNQSGDTRCHAGGHGPRNVTHPLPFTDPTLHGPEAKKDLTYCQSCHGQPGGPGSNPRFNLTIGFLAHGCEDCHPTNAGHPKPWADHNTAGNVLNACTLCHGANLEGGTGPSCSECHTSLAAGDVPVLGTCVSCHGKAPSGSSFPNIAGAHPSHNNSSFTGVYGVCNTCHNGGGTGTANHANATGTVTVSFLATYNAETDTATGSGPGTATFDPTTLTCTNVSCHGGNTTPPWRTGSIDVSSECTSCHSLLSPSVPASVQYNSYYSGRHGLHTLPPSQGGSVRLACTDCHDPAKLAAKHFSGLDTHTFEGNPADTIRTDVNYVSGSCSPQNSGTNFSISQCHFSNPQSWQQ